VSTPVLLAERFFPFIFKSPSLCTKPITPWTSSLSQIYNPLLRINDRNLKSGNIVAMNHLPSLVLQHAVRNWRPSAWVWNSLTSILLNLTFCQLQTVVPEVMEWVEQMTQAGLWQKHLKSEDFWTESRSWSCYHIPHHQLLVPSTYRILSHKPQKVYSPA